MLPLSPKTRHINAAHKSLTPSPQKKKKQTKKLKQEQSPNPDEATETLFDNIADTDSATFAAHKINTKQNVMYNNNKQQAQQQVGVNALGVHD